MFCKAPLSYGHSRELDRSFSICQVAKYVPAIVCVNLLTSTISLAATVVNSKSMFEYAARLLTP